jgi:Protein of unknown function with HXXEE motif
MLNRLIVHWVYGGTLAGVLLLLLFPLLARSWPMSLALIFLHLPMYMLHQYEEHDNDRFRLFVNQKIGGGKEVLSPLAVFIINVPGVWGVIAISMYLASYIHLGLGLIAVYLAVVNGVVHVAHAFMLKCYNPGLFTSIVLFLPVGIYTIWQIQRAGSGQAGVHAIGLGVAIAIHIGIVGYALAKRALAEKK